MHINSMWSFFQKVERLAAAINSVVKDARCMPDKVKVTILTAIEVLKPDFLSDDGPLVFSIPAPDMYT